ncbi:hypothetical protein [Myroides odoratus]|uniref:hypothetical protein n=1 Tax=Myroides odoratus TaxID=256 RepID=UPI00333EFF2E
MNRKEFILSSSLFFLGINFLRSSPLLPAVEFQLQNKKKSDVPLLLKKAADLRKKSFVYQQEKVLKSRRSLFFSPTNNANSIYIIYDQILKENPEEIRAYNGKRKFMLQDNRTSLDVLNMYLDGAKINANNSIFLERLAKEYLRILSGSSQQLKKLPSPYNDKKKLLDSIEKYFEKAIQLDGTNEQYSVQLKKLQELKLIGFFTIDPRKNMALKAQKKERKLVQKKLEATLSSSDYQVRIKRLKDRKKDPIRMVQIANLEKKHIKKLQKEKNFSLSVERCMQYYQANPKDVDGLKLVRLTLAKNRRYDLLESIERKNVELKESFWSYIALTKVLFIRIEREGYQNFGEISTLIDKADKLAVLSNQKFEVKCRRSKLNVLVGSPNTEKELLAFGSELIGLRNRYRIDRYTRLCVEFFQSKNQSNLALMAIETVLNQDNFESDENSILVQLQHMGRYRESMSLQDNMDLEMLRQKILNA